MTFDEWWNAHPLSKEEDMPLIRRAFKETAQMSWNAALEVAAELADVYGESIHLPSRIRELKHTTP
jgi:hypothetical protein